jgi:hypothetical protein
MAVISISRLCWARFSGTNLGHHVPQTFSIAVKCFQIVIGPNTTLVCESILKSNLAG